MAVLEIKPTYAQDGAAALLIHSNGFLGAAVNRGSNPCRGCAGINRHVVGEEESLQERRKRLHLGLESCGGDREVFAEA